MSNSYVIFNISTADANPTAPSFGKVLILSNGNQFSTNEVRTYFAGQIGSDFTTNQFPYQAAAQIFAQRPSLESVKVALLPTPASAQTLQVGLAALPSGSDVSVVVTNPAGTVTSLTVEWDTNHNTTALALSDAIGALSGISGSSGGGNTVTLTAGSEGQLWHIDSDTFGVSVLDTSPDFDYDDQLENILAIDSDFFAIVIDCNSAKNIDKVARWALTNNRMAFFGPQATIPSNWTSSLFTAGQDHADLMANDRAVLLFTKSSRKTPKEAAWLSKLLPEVPGKATWAFKRLGGVGADSYTATEQAQILDHDGAHIRGGNVIKSEMGQIHTFGGQVASGLYIDEVLDIAWMQAQIETDVYAMLLNSKKIPYTSAGAAMIAGQIRAVLVRAEAEGVIDEGWSVNVLGPEAQSSQDRANRVYRYASFNATKTGAIHKIYINGSVV
jgi:hypothetical protein